MKSKTILIADDDAAFVNALAVRCKTLGLKTQTCHDAMFALTMIYKNPPDLVLLDVTMPAGNGLAVCEMLATDQRLSQIPVIILTGAADDDTVRRCSAMGARYVQKTSNLWSDLKVIICDELKLPLPSQECVRR